MKYILFFLILLIISFSCKYYKGKGNVEIFEDAKLSFKVKIDSFHPYKVSVNVINKGNSDLMISTPFRYYIVSYKIFDKNDIEYFSPKINTQLNLNKEVIILKPSEQISGISNPRIDLYAGKSDIKNWYKIIAYYRYYAYKNGTNVITDTLINNSVKN